MATMYFASDYAYGINPMCEAGIVVGGSNAAGVTGTLIVNKPTIPTYVGRTFSAFNTNAPVNVDQDAAVVVSAVSTNYPGGQCSLTLTTPTHAHGQGSIISSGTAGLQEAINDATTRTGGGVVIVDGRWTTYGGTTAMITSAIGTAPVVVFDWRGTAVTQYIWNGSAYVQSGSAGSATTANGAAIAYGSASELLTLSTGGATSDTTANLLPANSWILGVVYRVTTTINNVTSWQPGDPTTTGRFGAQQSSGQLTAGATWIGNVFNTTGINSATTGMYQAAAAKARITTAGGTQNTTGAIRITVFYYTLTAPTS